MTREPLDLADVTGAEAITWLATLAEPRQSVWPHRRAEVNLDRVLPFLRAGLTRTDVIIEHADHAEILTTLPEGHHLTPEDVPDFLLVGGPAWVGDPENRDAWVAVGRAAAQHATVMADVGYGSRYAADGKPRYHGLAPHEAVTALHTAGRGPSYALRIIEVATRHLGEIDAFGFGEEITPATLDDLFTAGVRNRADLIGYLRTGLDLAEAIAYRHDGIRPAAVLFAQRENVPREQWRETLAPLPTEWFRDLSRDEWPEDDTPNLLHSHGNDRYTLADLRHLAEHGWTGEDRLTPGGLNVTPAQTAPTARDLAEHGLTWADAERWAEALTLGKAPDPRYRRTETTTAPLVGWGRRRGTQRLDLDLLPEVLALADAGLKPSHMAVYRKAGCDSIKRVIEARGHGITPALAERLLREYGRQPSTYKTTRLFDSYADLLAAFHRHEEVSETGTRRTRKNVS